MKRTTLSLTLVVAMLILASQAFAWGGGGRGACGACPYASVQQNAPTQTDPAAAENYQKYLNATKDLRKQLAADRVELQAILASNQPDAKEARKVAERINDTEEKLAAKAQELNVTAGCPGYGYGMGRGYGMGPGYGRGMRGTWN